LKGRLVATMPHRLEECSIQADDRIMRPKSTYTTKLNSDLANFITPL